MNIVYSENFINPVQRVNEWFMIPGNVWVFFFFALLSITIRYAVLIIEKKKNKTKLATEDKWSN